MKLEAFKKRDLTNIPHLKPEGWPDLVPEFQFYLEAPYCCAIKVIEDGSIIGLGASIVFGSTSWLSHIIVDENYRNRGIGSSIVEYLLEELAKQSVNTCMLLATKLGQPVYQKFGFTPVGEYTYMKREQSSQQPFTSSMVQPISQRYHQEILDLDRRITGEQRAPLLKNHLDHGFLYLENDHVAGFYLPNLREGLILAENKRAGIALMQTKYSDGSIIRAVLPSVNKTGIEFLEQVGFSLTDKTGIRMVRGEHVDWKPECIYSRIAGNFG